MPRPAAIRLSLVLALALGGCAGGPRPPHADIPLPRLFVSPAGEPFLGEPGEPWPVSDWFIGADGDLDGSLTFAEFAADGRRWFARLDAAPDGRLDQAELAAYEQRLRALAPSLHPGPGGAGGPRRERPRRAPAAGLAEPQDHRGPMRGPRGGPGRGAAGYGVVAEAGFFNLPQPVKAADVNVDQRVTAAEWDRALERWFIALDADHDGALTLDTLPKTPLQRRAEARARP